MDVLFVVLEVLVLVVVVGKYVLVVVLVDVLILVLLIIVDALVVMPIVLVYVLVLVLLVIVDVLVFVLFVVVSVLAWGPTAVLDVLDVVVVVSQLLQVLSHSPDTVPHNECLDIVWHCSNENLLRLFAHRSTVLVVELVVAVAATIFVELGVVVVVVSQLLQVLAH